MEKSLRDVMYFDENNELRPKHPYVEAVLGPLRPTPPPKNWLLLRWALAVDAEKRRAEKKK